MPQVVTVKPLSMDRVARPSEPTASRRGRAKVLYLPTAFQTPAPRLLASEILDQLRSQLEAITNISSSTLDKIRESLTVTDQMVKIGDQIRAAIDTAAPKLQAHIAERESREQKFRRLADEWRQATQYTSSGTEVVTNSAYQRIIGMGREVLPILLRELETAPDDWFWALSMITEENPVKPEDAGDIEKMAAAWLTWARDQHYQW